MSSYNKFNQFTEDLAKGVHNLATGALVIALCDDTHKPVASNSVLANLTQAVYTNFSGNGSGSGGRTCSTTSCLQTAGALELILVDLVLTAINGTTPGFCEVVLYNDTPTSPADPLICWWEYGTGVNITLALNETFTVDFDPAGVLELV